MNHKQNKAPLVEALQQFVNKNPQSFHVPGHKSGANWNSTAKTYADSELAQAFATMLPYDLTELPGLDDLHAPDGAIAEAQQLAAELYGADATYFLVGGSTVGNLAFILGTCDAGDTVIVDRNVHKSVLHGLMMAEVHAVFVDTAIQEGIPMGPDVQQMLQAIERYPRAKAVILTRPTYYGTVIELKEMIQVAQKKNMVVFVDEAHGAHFGLHPELPQSALQLGADVVVQSTHKMMPAMTMAAMLHIRGTKAAKASIARYLHMLQSSSPSYPILASIDLARRYAATEATAQIAQTLAQIQHIKLDNNTVQNEDPFKWIYRDASGTYSGYALYARLAERGIYAEMADQQQVVFYFGLHTTMEQLEHLQQTLNDILPQGTVKPYKHVHQNEPASLSEIHFTRKMLDQNQPAMTVPLEQAIGKRVAEMVIPYPPGVAMLLPGEQLNEAHIERLDQLRIAGAHVQGISDRTLTTIRVYIEEQEQ